MKARKVTEPFAAITRHDDEGTSLKTALDLLPVSQMIKKGDVVVITPNWVKAYAPASGAVVGPQTLRALIRYVQGFSPGEIIVATGSGGDSTKNVFMQMGFDQVIHSEGVRFVDLNYGPYSEIELEHGIVRKTKINQLVEEMDVLISFTQLKQHEEATISGAIKNIALGWPPAEIHGFPKKNLGIHEDLHGFIRAMAKKIPIDLSIISCDKAMVATGPSEGIPVDTQGLIIAATDPVAADCLGARLLGFLPQAVQYLYALHNDQVGEADPRNMTIRGLSLEEAEIHFSLSAYGQPVVLDKNNQYKDIHGNR